MHMNQVTIFYPIAGETRWNVLAEHASAARAKARAAARLDGLNDPLHDGFVVSTCASREGRLLPPTLPHRRRWKLRS